MINRGGSDRLSTLMVYRTFYNKFLSKYLECGSIWCIYFFHQVQNSHSRKYWNISSEIINWETHFNRKTLSSWESLAHVKENKYLCTCYNKHCVFIFIISFVANFVPITNSFCLLWANCCYQCLVRLDTQVTRPPNTHLGNPLNGSIILLKYKSNCCNKKGLN